MEENPKVAGGHPTSQMGPGTHQVTAHRMCVEARGFAKAHPQPLHGAWAVQAPDGLEGLRMVPEQGSEELEAKHSSFARGTQEKGGCSDGREGTAMQRCRARGCPHAPSSLQQSLSSHSLGRGRDMAGYSITLLLVTAASPSSALLTGSPGWSAAPWRCRRQRGCVPAARWWPGHGVAPRAG